ncbi:unnamed protein product [Urochloa decumbens]|uniref:DUF1618 domain-containing protein n=1 Tax=Urochloa decumbens TaxID=240449 RepID=A0ABC9B9Q7_9POAL
MQLRRARSASSATYPRWVLLQEEGCGMVCDEGSPSSPTTVTARSSAGDPIQLYLDLVEPPAVSTIVCAKLPDGGYPYSTIVAAHGDSILIKVFIEGRMRGETTDIFVYNAGAAAADPPRPPSLSLLPPCYHTFGNGWPPKLYIGMPPIGMSQHQEPHHATGMLRRGEDEIAVVELMMVEAIGFRPGPKTAELLLFRSGEWCVICPQIVSSSRDCGELSSSWTTDTVVPVADQLLCWVDLTCGILFCDVFEESPRMQFLPLPMDPCYGRASNRNVCVTAGGAMLKFVNIFPRCCCGGKGATLTGCLCSLNAYTISTWTLRMSDMEWVKDGMFHNTELWGLDAYYDERLPRIVPTYPVVSMDEPHTISFLLCDEHGYDRWLITVDMKSKTLRSATPYFRGSWGTHGRTLIPSSLSYYLNSSPSCIRNVTSTGQSHIERPQMVIVDEQVRDHNANNLTMQSSCQPSTEPAVQASEILAALEEIPTYGLDDDMLKAAYRILRRGGGRRFRSLLSVPMNLRKDWLLMEIETSED